MLINLITLINNITKMITKQLLRIEFRWNEHEYKSKRITIGVYDTIEEAVTAGNNLLASLNNEFEIRADDKFSVKGKWGIPTRLVTNVCYKDHVKFFAKIEQLNYIDIFDEIKEIKKLSIKPKPCQSED